MWRAPIYGASEIRSEGETMPIGSLPPMGIYHKTTVAHADKRRNICGALCFRHRNY